MLIKKKVDKRYKIKKGDSLVQSKSGKVHPAKKVKIKHEIRFFGLASEDIKCGDLISYCLDGTIRRALQRDYPTKKEELKINPLIQLLAWIKIKKWKK